MSVTRKLARPEKREPPPAGAAWTVLHLVEWSSAYLEEKGIAASRLDVEHLLAETLGMDRLSLYLEFDRPLTPGELTRFKPRLLERAGHRPLQYILGRVPFRALELMVDERVMIPRPETEELVDAVLRRVGDSGGTVRRALDVGTGSGAIALSLAKEGGFERVVATDSSEAALEVARSNASANRLDSRVEFRCGDSLDPIRDEERFDVVVSNPPYVSEEAFTALPPEVRLWEPRGALVAREGGLDMLRRLVAASGAVLETGGLLALEVGAGQAPVVAERIRATGGFGPPSAIRDLAGVERIVLARWKGNGGFHAGRPSGHGARRD